MRGLGLVEVDFGLILWPLPINLMNQKYNFRFHCLDNYFLYYSFLVIVVHCPLYAGVIFHFLGILMFQRQDPDIYLNLIQMVTPKITAVTVVTVGFESFPQPCRNWSRCLAHVYGFSAV